MSTIPGDPIEYPAGQLFDYAVWTQNTTITLYNVPWNNDYRDVVDFQGQTIDEYLDSLPSSLTVSRAQYARADRPIRLNLPFNRVNQYNYLRAENPVQPVPGADTPFHFYYFIIGVNYVGPNNTEVILQLDVWQTYRNRWTLGNAYIERGHVGIANDDAFGNFGRDNLTIPEGLDTGADYQIANSIPVFPDVTNHSYKWLIQSTVNLEQDAIDESGKALPPMAADGGIFGNVSTGVENYIVDGDGTSLRLFIGAFSQYPWLSQGIQSITAIPFWDAFYPDWESQKDPITLGPAAGKGYRSPTINPVAPTVTVLANWRDTMAQYFGTRYAGLKKFLTYPYTMIELTAWDGTPIMLSPENWNDANASVTVALSPLPPEQFVMALPRNYNSRNSTPVANPGELHYDLSESLDFFTKLQNFPQMAITNNLAGMFQASNQNSLAFQIQSADWSQQKALRSNQTSYDQATNSMNTQSDLTESGILQSSQVTDLNNRKAIFDGTVGAINSTISGAGAGGPAGAVIGGSTGIVSNALNAAVATSVNNQMLGFNSDAARRNTNISNANSGYVRDTNKSLADWAANGDYENVIASQNARVQDSKFVQPSTSGQMGGQLFKLMNSLLAIHVRIKVIDTAHIRSIGDYWLRYGYAVNRFVQMPSTLNVMSKFTYWKLRETYISSASIPEDKKQSIRGILEKGVTVWSDPADIGTVDIADNQPIEGITL